MDIRIITLARAMRRTGPPAAVAVCALILFAGMTSAAPPAAEDGHRDSLPAMTDGSGATRCALQITGLDQAGAPVVRTLALALDRPGLLAAPLGRLRASAGRWSVLQAAPDSGRPGSDASPVAITGLVELREDLALAVLSAPGLPACEAARPEASTPPADGVAGATEPVAGAPTPTASAARAVADPVIGIRERIGYRPRVFRVGLERAVRLADGRDLLVARIPDGGGAESGFVLDGRQRLAGAILPPPPAADDRLACVLPVTAMELSRSGGEDGPVLPLAMLRADDPTTDGDHPILMFAASLRLSRVDQVDRALDMMRMVARSLGEFSGLLMERGALQFRAGRTTGAIADFSQAARLEPQLHTAHYDLGIALGSLGRYDEAAAALETAARIAPDHARTLFHLALAYQAAGRSSAIRRQYESLAAIDPGLAGELKTLLGLP